MTHAGSQRLVLTGLVLTFIAIPSLGADDRSRSPGSEHRSEGELSGELFEVVTSPPGSYVLSIDGDFALGGFVFKGGFPFLHNDGGPSAHNTALGLNALVSSTPGVPFGHAGKSNTALGDSALRYNTTGSNNTASGISALYSNTTGSYNTASGVLALYANATGERNTATGAAALYSNTAGSSNTASGWGALASNTTGDGNSASSALALRYNTTGDFNTAGGTAALLSNTEGSRNTALGNGAGRYNTTGSSNIWIASYGNSLDPGESNTLRIGKGTGTGDHQQTRAFISGILNASGTFSQDICVNSSDQLGPCGASSVRFKEDIEAMAEASEGVLALRPVKFRYKEEFAGEVERGVRYGLIAEEVAELYPELVTYDPEGRAVTVRYDALTPLLLNELQRQQAELMGLRATQARVEEQEELLREQIAVLTELRFRLARLEAADRAREGPAANTRW